MQWNGLYEIPIDDVMQNTHGVPLMVYLKYTPPHDCWCGNPSHGIRDYYSQEYCPCARDGDNVVTVIYAISDNPYTINAPADKCTYMCVSKHMFGSSMHVEASKNSYFAQYLDDNDDDVSFGMEPPNMSTEYGAHPHCKLITELMGGLTPCVFKGQGKKYSLYIMQFIDAVNKAVVSKNNILEIKENDNPHIGRKTKKKKCKKKKKK